MFLNCPKQWEFRYVKGLKIPPKGALTIGSAVDDAITHNLGHKIQTNTNVPLEEALDTYSTSFDARSPDTEWEGSDPGEQKDMGAACVSAHHLLIAPKMEPETVQEEFHLWVDDEYDVSGFIDVIETTGVVVDSKTSSRKWGADKISQYVQPVIYDFAYEATRGKKARGFRWDVMIKPTKASLKKAKDLAKIQQLDRPVLAQEHKFLFDEALPTMHKLIKRGLFPPAGDSYWGCSEKYCGFWHLCKGKKR